MRHRNVVAVDRIARPARLRACDEMGDDLVAEEIEVHPILGAPPLGTAEQPAVKGARGGKIVDREGEMEGAP